ncbi:hypothetical protein IJJ05_00930 [Candidatus Saccharibacteria bacterium]|nr:hypothetical protein [Candidatus Saccharibacteria bacterium]
MVMKKRLKIDFKKAIFGFFFVAISIFGLMGPMFNVNEANAVPVETTTSDTEGTGSTSGTATNNSETNTNATGANVDSDGANAENTEETVEQSGDGCKSSLGAIGWLVCPTTGKIAEAVDWLYEKLEDILVINPIAMEDGSPIYEIWKYCRGLTNIIFIIFLLVVIYSQITGVGISNYGIKRALPKLIIAAVLVNLSFLICSLAVDVSNIFGNGIRGLFASIGESALGGGEGSSISIANMYGALVGGSALAVAGGVIAFELGAIWMLIPTVLGALVAVASGLITIALRQAVVALLIMISPLAMVAYILPNTENLFKKWKSLLTKMLVFYPMFSLLFGASSLAGFAIITSAKNGFGVLLGVAVQIFPLFFSWSLMRMSGTFLGDINTRLRGMAAGPLATNRAWADSHRQLTKQKRLAAGRATTPSLRLMQFISNRRIDREAEIAENAQLVKERGMAYRARRNWQGIDANSLPTKRGRRTYENQARSLEYQRVIERDKNTMNKGLGYLAKEGTAERARLDKLDTRMVNAADALKAEYVRGAKVDYENAKGFFDRTLNAQFAYDDQMRIDDKKHRLHTGVLEDPNNLKNFERIKQIMDGDSNGAQEVLADAASTLTAQAQIRRNKFQAASTLTPATQNVADHLSDLVKSPDAMKNIDAIIGGLRVLSMRGDTDLVAREMSHNLVGILADKGRMEGGTYASQAIANYAMFEVKDSDPLLRRWGKYINMQTAAMYDDVKPGKERRNRKDISWWEYINSEYVEYDENGNVAQNPDGTVKTVKTRGMKELMPGTSYAKVERTGFKSEIEGIRAAAYDVGADGKLSSEFSLKRFLDNEGGFWNAVMPNIIGDQFSYLSGSEQITALAKALTGVDVKKHKFDWKYIFGDELKEPSLEQKAAYILKSRDRVKQFLGGHVPVQIARSKSDMLEAIKTQYALLSEIVYKNEKGEELIDLERLEKLEKRKFVDGGAEVPDSYINFENKRMDKIKERFVESFKKDALKGFSKMYKKGYQGEAKDALIQLLDPESLYERYYPRGENNNKRSNNKSSHNRDYDEDEDEGMLVDADFGGGSVDGSVYNEARFKIESAFKEYRGARRLDVIDFWNETKDILETMLAIEDQAIIMNEIEEGLSQYTDVSQLHERIMRVFFGSN